MRLALNSSLCSSRFLSFSGRRDQTHLLAVLFSSHAFLETSAMQATEQLRLILMLMTPFWSCYTNMACNWLGESVLIVQKLQLVAISREKKVSCYIVCHFAAYVWSFILFESKQNFIESADQLNTSFAIGKRPISVPMHIQSLCKIENILYYL